MKSVFLLQWQRFRRSPILVVSFFVLTVVFVFFLAGSAPGSQMTIYTYAVHSLGEEERDQWLSLLNESDIYEFKLVEESEARRAVTDRDINVAVQLMEDDYRFLIATDDPNRHLIEGHVNQVFSEELRLREVEELGAESTFRQEVEKLQDEPVLNVETSLLGGGEGSFQDDERLQVLVGMTLYFAGFTIMFCLVNVSEEKRAGTWNRLIVSPLRKWQIYIGHLLYCFMIGYAQILAVFLLFKYVLGFDMGDRFGTVLFVIGCYVFAIVALGMLLIGIVKTTQQLQAIIPIVSTSMAMLGGAFWPIEIVTNEIMLMLSKGMPILYGIEAVKGAAMYDRGVFQLLEPISIMLLFGVVCMGVGINLMERR
ncbi:ABC transporter permease [Evansella cellulosilytica]|uniref:ABC-2 type transporter n=1 Tax=Evansella cellulosilytica (strain ATCC 21833 / DSM 2522 / FERM P-1141 / JCM 9156 / N-4) TaxID=649639 RepID=E6TZC2_EVAC2|nr:ABC transporter permease [Evansella cellulosilytica]ADU28984.1 ABC-2 type transporter [Evansella cellulosilytica DSM 2522]